MWLQEKRHLRHHQARWLNLLAEYQYTVVHIPGRTNPADFLTRKRFRDGQGPALTTGHDDPGSSLELYAIDLLTGRVWLIPTFKTATAEMAARNFVSSVFRDVGLPDVLV